MRLAMPISTPEITSQNRNGDGVKMATIGTSVKTWNITTTTNQMETRDSRCVG